MTNEIDEKLAQLKKLVEEKELEKQKELDDKNLSYEHFEKNREELQQKHEEELTKKVLLKEKKEKDLVVIKKFETYFFENYIPLFKFIVKYLENGGVVDNFEKDFYKFIIVNEKQCINLELVYNYFDSKFIYDNIKYDFKIETVFDKFNNINHGNQYTDYYKELLRSYDGDENHTGTEFPYEKILSDYECKIDNLIYSNMDKSLFDKLKILEKEGYNGNDNTIAEVKVLAIETETDAENSPTEMLT